MSFTIAIVIYQFIRFYHQ